VAIHQGMDVSYGLDEPIQGEGWSPKGHRNDDNIGVRV